MDQIGGSFRGEREDTNGLPARRSGRAECVQTAPRLPRRRKTSFEASAAPPAINSVATATDQLGTANPATISSKVDNSGAEYALAPSTWISPRFTP